MVNYTVSVICILVLNVSTIFASNPPDDLFQKDGTVMRGRIMAQDRNGAVKFKTESNDLYIIDYDEIESMTQYIDPSEEIVDHRSNVC